MSDEELFARVKAGDGDALSALYDRHAHRVFAIARRVVLDRQAAEEVVQDVFTRIWTTSAFQPERGQFSQWVCVVARRIAIDHVRRRERTRDVPDSERVYRDAGGRRAGKPAFGESSFGESSFGESSFLERFLREDLARSISLLREEERVVLKKAYFEGKTLSEVAGELAIPIGTVKTRLHRALKAMRAGMADWQPEVLR